MYISFSLTLSYSGLANTTMVKVLYEESTASPIFLRFQHPQLAAELITCCRLYCVWDWNSGYEYI